MPSEHGSTNGTTTKVITRRVESGPPQILNPDVVATTKHEEWTTSKKVVNHKTKQVETRVQRQIILEDGKVVADSGPQVTTKTTEDNKVEETENTQHKKTADDPPDPGYVAIPGSSRIVSEKTESHQTMKETKEENMKLHDENLRELSGPDIHRKSVVLSTGESPFYSTSLDSGKPLPGKLTHFSSKSQKITDKEEVKETSETKNGEMTTETTRTHHHEEVHDDEVPENESGVGELSGSKSPKRITYYNHDDELDSLSDKLRKEKELNIIRDIAMERRDPVTRKALSIEEEEEIRNSETNRWLEDHFGSDESDIMESTTTKAGGNVINIQMSSTAKKPPPAPKIERESVPLHRQSVSHHVNKINSLLEENDFKTTTTRPQPINARFCGTREPEVVYTTLRTPTPNSQPSRFRESPITDNYSTLSSTRTPLKTYFLGQEGTYKAPRFDTTSTPLRRQSAPWKSTPVLNDEPVYSRNSFSHFDNRVRQEVSARERNARSPVQRSMSQRDISPRQQVRARVSAQDDTIIHKFSSNDFLNEDDPNPWVSSKTLPRGTKFTAKTKNGNDHQTRHRTSYSEVQTFNRGLKTDRSIQVELSDDDDTTTRSTLSRIRSPSPGDTELLNIHKYHSRKNSSYSPASTPTKPSKHFYFGDSSKNDYRKSYGKTNGSYSDGYGSLPSSKDRFPDKEDSIDQRMASFNTYCRSTDRSYDNSPLTSLERNDYTSTTNNSNHRYSTDSTKEYRRNEESRKNSKNSVDNRTYLHVDCDYDRQQNGHHKKTSSTDRRHFIDTLLNNSEENGYNRKSSRDTYRNQSPQNSSPSSSSPPPRLIRADRYGGSSSLSPPDSPVAPPPPPPPPPPVSGLYSSTGSNTWNRNQGKSVKTQSPVMNPPSFTPLLSPVEIKNMANRFSKKSTDEKINKYMEVKPGTKPGTVVVEVRDWGNR